MKHFNKILFVLIAITSFTSCKKYFDVNSDPTSPQSPDLATLLPPVLANAPFHHSVEGANAAQLAQHFIHNTNGAVHSYHGGNAGGASATSFWRTFYVTMGTSINMIIDKGMIEENWDYVGVGYAMKAWGFQQATDYFGELPFHEAWKSNQVSFRYDNQDVVYKGIDSLLRTALMYLNRTDGEVAKSSLSRGDVVYKGDRNQWVKFVYGLMARHYSRLSNKSNYMIDAYHDSIIKYVDLSFASQADNFKVPFTGTKNDDTNPYGPARSNFNTLKKSRYITQLLDGTILHGTHTPISFTPGATIPANRDPRLRAMLTFSKDSTTFNASLASNNGGYRYNVLSTTSTGGGEVEPTVTNRRPAVVYGDTLPTNLGGGQFNNNIGHYIFKNVAPFTLMAYHELQFIKAEAALRKGDKALAHQAYINGISAHMDFVNSYATVAPASPSITAAQKSEYLASGAVEQIPDGLTLTDIMQQKFIGDWAWNPYESWADLRRYHYFDLDPATNVQVYQTFSIPVYSTNNLGPKPAYRFLPTNVSEFDWNEQELRRIGGFNQDYHTYEMWFSQP